MENVDLNKKPGILAPLLLSSLPSVGLSGFFAYIAISEGETLLEHIVGILTIVLGIANIVSLFLIRHFRIDYLTAFLASCRTFVKLLFLFPVFGFLALSSGLKIGIEAVTLLYVAFCVFMIVRRVILTLDEGLMDKVIENKPVQNECCSERMQVILITLINPIIPFLPMMGFLLLLCGFLLLIIM